MKIVSVSFEALELINRFNKMVKSS